MYNLLDLKKTSELFLVRQGWFSHVYLLTDKVCTYGKITYHRFSGRKVTVETAAGTCTFQRGPVFSRTISIASENEGVIGSASREWFNRRTTLTLTTGFKADFYRPSVFSREYVWESEGYGKIMQFESPLFSLTTAIDINQSKTPPSLIPLLAFLGSYLIILSRRRSTRH